MRVDPSLLLEKIPMFDPTWPRETCETWMAAVRAIVAGDDCEPESFYDHGCPRCQRIVERIEDDANDKDFDHFTLGVLLSDAKRIAAGGDDE